MTDRFRPAPDGRKKSLWRRIVELEQILLKADFGLDATVALIEELEQAARRGSVRTEVELRKMDRVLGRVIPGAPHERWLVVEATAGQNVLSQARDFGAAVELDGLVLAKFDSDRYLEKLLN